MNRCKICITPDTRPDVTFTDGVCPACISHAKKPEIDWSGRIDQLHQLLDAHHGECIVPSSGGKDSTFQALFLKNMGADVTAVTARTCHLTPTGRANIDNLARHVRTIEIVPNLTVRAKLNRLGLTMVGDISWPEHASIFSTPFRVARDLNIPLIFYGENPQNQYGGPHGTDEARQMTARWVSEFGGFLGLRPSDFVGMEGITSRDMADYKPVDFGEAHFLGQYTPWDSHNNARIAAEAGMIQFLPTPANLWPHENLDNAQTGIHDFFSFLKYGFARYTTQASVDIRDGLMTREKAIENVHREQNLYGMYAGVTLNEILDRIDLTAAQFKEIRQEWDNNVGD